MSSTRRCFCGKGSRSRKAGRISDAKSWEFVDAVIEQYLPKGSTFSISDRVDSVRRSMAYWLGWNKMIEARFGSPAVVQLETMTPDALIDALGVKPSLKPQVVAGSHVSPEKEKKKLPDITWDLMNETDPVLAKAIREMAIRYKYPDIALHTADDAIAKLVDSGTSTAVPSAAPTVAYSALAAKAAGKYAGKHISDAKKKRVSDKDVIFA